MRRITRTLTLMLLLFGSVGFLQSAFAENTAKANTWLSSNEDRTSSKEQRSWTPKDSIAVTYYERGPYGWSTVTPENAVQHSPDGRYFYFITRRGDLSCDCNIFDLMVFDVVSVKRDMGRPGSTSTLPFLTYSLKSRASHTFYSGLSGARWEDDSRGILFLGAQDDSPAQIYHLDIATGEARIITRAALGVSQFDAKGHSLIYRALIAKKPKTNLDVYPMSVVGEYGLSAVLAATYTPIYHVFASYKDAPAVDLGPVSGSDEFLLAPDGRHAIGKKWIQATQLPPAWQGYAQADDNPTAAIYRRSHQKSDLFALQYTVIDLKTGEERPVFSAPEGSYLGYSFDGTYALWFPAGDRVVLVNTLLPLKDGKPESQYASYLIDFSLTARTWRVLSQMPSTPDFLQEITWLVPGKQILASFGSAGDSKSTIATARIFTLHEGRWTSKPAQQNDVQEGMVQATTDGFSVAVREDANEPPAVVANYKGREMLLTTPDPALVSIKRAPVEAVEWQDRHGRSWSGGLMLPDTAVGAERVPLVILAYAFEADRFLPDGFTTTAFAAQALASRGMAVLQMRSNLPVWTPNQGTDFVEGIDSAVQELARRGVDAAQVGLVGFSQTSALVAYAVTHPGQIPLSAAISADNGEAGYLLYLSYSVISPDLAGVGRQYSNFNGNGDLNFWENKESWLKQAPGFNLDRVRTPLLLTLNGRQNIRTACIEMYAGLRILEKPVDYIFFPEGEHELRRPQERLASMEATVDWFAFWLKGKEDRDAAKAEQYMRWRELRRQHETHVAEVRTSRIDPASLPAVPPLHSAQQN